MVLFGESTLLFIMTEENQWILKTGDLFTTNPLAVWSSASCPLLQLIDILGGRSKGKKKTRCESLHLYKGITRLNDKDPTEILLHIKVHILHFTRIVNLEGCQIFVFSFFCGIYCLWFLAALCKGGGQRSVTGLSAKHQTALHQIQILFFDFMLSFKEAACY